MSNATVLSIGQINGAGATDALFLKVFGGEVLAAFQEANKVMDKHTVRQISSGKSAQFPATWKVSAGYHTPGSEIVGQASNLAERVITIDDLLISSVFIANIDEAKAHYDVRGTYSREVGLSLAYQWDKNVLQVGVLAGRAAATITGASGGSVLTSATDLYRTSASDLAAGLFAASQKYDEKNIPEADTKYAFMRPAQYYLLAQNTNLINAFWTKNNGDYAKAEVLMVGNHELVKTNHLPNTNITTGPAAYQGDFSKTACLSMTKNAVGTVKLLDLAQEMQYDIRRQGTLMVAKYAIGHGILRPECAIELNTTT